MYFLEYMDMAGLWHILGEYNTYEEANQADQQFLYECNQGDYPYRTRIVSLAALTA